MIQQFPDLLLQTRVEVIQDHGVTLAILLVGYILVGYYTKTPIFYLIVSAIMLFFMIFFVIAYADFPGILIAFIAGYIFRVGYCAVFSDNKITYKQTKEE